MIIQKFFAVLVKLRNILRGWFKYLFFKPSELGKTRLNHCKVCQSRKGYFCGECGCVLVAKVEEETEECPLNKW